jgi:hypothetical protein
MSSSLYAILPAGAALGFVCAVTVMALRPVPRPGGWQLPAVLSAVFLAFSLWVVAREGPLGFWTLHSANGWGVQVWTDLLMAAATALFLLLPRARAVGMRGGLWIVLVACTGSIGLLAMLARCLFLEARRADPSTETAQ